MKKYLSLLVVAIAVVGCGGYIKNENGSENIKQLTQEPKDCLFLYKMETTVSAYKQDDARRYLENSIASQSRPGNAYLITDKRTKENPGAVFGPDESFIYTAKVYECSDLPKFTPKSAK